MFDPFEDRRSRDIRNQLSAAFLEALEQRDWAGLETAADRIRPIARDEDQAGFIEDRMAAYHALYQDGAGADPLNIARRLWDRCLFFECHEWLEPLWRSAEGSRKKALQGLIRAAGAHVLHGAGRPGPAASAAKKAMVLIRDHGAKIPKAFDTKTLAASLIPIVQGGTPPEPAGSSGSRSTGWPP